MVLSWYSWNCPFTNLRTKLDFPTADSPSSTSLNWQIFPCVWPLGRWTVPLLAMLQLSAIKRAHWILRKNFFLVGTIAHFFQVLKWYNRILVLYLCQQFKLLKQGKSKIEMATILKILKVRLIASVNSKELFAFTDWKRRVGPPFKGLKKYQYFYQCSKLDRYLQSTEKSNGKGG